MSRAAFVSIAVLVALPGGAAAKEQPKPRYGGTVVVAAIGEPSSLNVIVDRGARIAPGGLAFVLAYRGSHEVAPDFTYRTVLVSHATVERRSPTVLTLHIKRGARWADGRPVTARDFVTACRLVGTYGDADWSTHGCAFARLRALDARRVRVVFARSYAAWRWPFFAMPTHALEGVDVRTGQSDLDSPKTGRPLGNGPFLLESWRRGHSMTLIRNDRYFGKRPYLERLVIRFLPDAQTVVEALRRGEVDAAWDIALPVRELRPDPRIIVRSAASSNWEHLDFNLGHQGRGHPLLRKRFVREAIVRAVDRTAIARELYREEAPKLPVLQSVFLLRQHPQYKPWWANYRYEPARARRILERNGCRRGADGIYVCQGQRLSFRLSTTAGNALRQRAEEIVQRSLARAGIEVRIDNDPGGLFFNQRLPSGDYDLVIFAWSASTPELTDAFDIYACPTEAAQQPNRQGYCNPRVDRLFRLAGAEYDDRKRFTILNRALALVADDLPTLPLFQRPSFVAHRKTVHGVRGNSMSGLGPLWNVEWWWKEAPR